MGHLSHRKSIILFTFALTAYDIVEESATMTSHLQPSRLIACLLLAAITLLSGSELQARKPQSVCGCVYLHSGDTIAASGETRITPPAKRKKLEVIGNAYTRASKVASRIDPTTVDSVAIWSTTSPERHHTLIYIKEYGWCWQLEHTPHIALYCYSPKGYFLSGNGGMWIRGKGDMLVVKDGNIHNFGKTYKKINASKRRKLKELVADDPALAAYFRTAAGRYDKVLRALGYYNPD